MKDIYEVVENSGDNYWTLGLFSSLDEAKKTILEYKKECSICEWSEDYEKISVYKREVNVIKESVGEKVFSVTREQTYSEEEDKYLWEACINDNDTN